MRKMISVYITRQKDGCIRQVRVKGHAGFAGKGSDIVCAAASVTAYTAAGALEELAGIKDCYSVKDGYMLINIPEGIRDEQLLTAKVILETTAIGFKQIEMEYGDYIKVFDEEV